MNYDLVSDKFLENVLSHIVMTFAYLFIIILIEKSQNNSFCVFFEDVKEFYLLNLLAF